MATMKWEEALSHVGTLMPEPIRQNALDTLQHYIWITGKPGSRRGYCTACLMWLPVGSEAHKETGHCPHCGRAIASIGDSAFADCANPNSLTNTETPELQFINMKDGIGCGLCPVYTAPSFYAYRCNDGKAECATDNALYIGGFNAERWLMVRYETNNGATRVGYIPPKYAKSFNYWETLDFSYVQIIADTTLSVTDNPMDNYSAFATIDSGETYYILGDYNYHGDWWYIECTVDGKVARGFIEK